MSLETDFAIVLKITYTKTADETKQFPFFVIKFEYPASIGLQ